MEWGLVSRVYSFRDSMVKRLWGYNTVVCNQNYWSCFHLDYVRLLNVLFLVFWLGIRSLRRVISHESNLLDFAVEVRIFGFVVRELLSSMFISDC